MVSGTAANRGECSGDYHLLSWRGWVLDNFTSQARPVRLVSVPLYGGVGELEDIFLTKPLRSPSQTLPARTPQLPSRVSSEKEAPSASRSWASTSTGQNQAQPQPHPCPHIPSHSRS